MPDFGDGSAREDWGGVDPLAPSVANGGITPEQWAEYQRKRKRAAILGTLSVLGGTTALGAAGMAMSGAGAAGTAASAAPSAAPAATGAGWTMGGVTAPSFGAATSAAGTTAAGTTAAGGSMAATKGSLLSRLLPSILGAAGTAVKGVVGVRAGTRDRESNERIARERMAHDRELAEMDNQLGRDKLALDESELDPFRALLAQIEAAERFDRIATDTPLTFDWSGDPYASNRPRITGGTYAPSDDLRAAATTARTTALSGQGANRSVVDPNATRQLLDLLAQSGKTPVNRTQPMPYPAGGRPQPMQDPSMAVGLETPNDFDLSFMDTLPQAMPRRTALQRRRKRPVMTGA